MRKLVLLLLLIPLVSRSQNCLVDGQVLDEHGHILQGVSIALNGSSKGVVSNSTGQFKLSVPCDQHVKVRFFFLGFQTLDTLVKSGSTVAITLTSSVEHLHEHVVEEHVNSDHSSLSNEEISAQEILENNQGTLIKSLEIVPGIQAINVGVGIAKPVLRGMSFNRVVVTGNGVKQEGQQWGADHGLEMDPFDAEHVEIIKGPSTIKYGSGSAAGVINILPFHIAAQDSVEGELNLVYKSNNNHIGVSGMAKANHNDFFTRVRLTHQQFGDYRIPADSFIYNQYELPVYEQQLKNTAGNEYNGSAEFGVLRKWGISRITASTYNLEAGIFPGAMGIPRSYDLEPDSDSRNVDVPKQNVSHHKITSLNDIYGKNGKSQFKLLASWQQNVRREFASPHAHGSVQTGTKALDLNLQTFNLNAQVKHQLSGILAQEGGIQSQYQINQIGGFEYLIPNYIGIDLAGFYMLKYTQSDRVEWNGGVRLGAFLIEAEEALLYGTADSTSDGSIVRSEAFSRSFFNWSAALGTRLELSTSSNLKLNASRSYRNPSIAELGSNGVHHGTFRHEQGNSELNQESGLHLDAAYALDKATWELNLAGFASHYADFIYLKPTSEFSNLPEGGQLFKYTQNNAVFIGGELEFVVNILEQWQVKLGGDYVWNQNLDTDLPLPFTPPGRILSSFRYRLEFEKAIEKIDFLLGYNYTMAQDRVDRNELSTPGYHLWRLGIISHFKTKRGSDIRLHCTVQNLFDVAYFNHLSRYRYLNIPEQGRNIVLGLDVPFGF